VFAGAPSSKYDLVANVVHDGRAGEGTYRAHIHRKAEEIWYEVQVRRASWQYLVCAAGGLPVLIQQGTHCGCLPSHACACAWVPVGARGALLQSLYDLEGDAINPQDGFMMLTCLLAWAQSCSDPPTE